MADPPLPRGFAKILTPVIQNQQAVCREDQDNTRSLEWLWANLTVPLQEEEVRTQAHSEGQLLRIWGENTICKPGRKESGGAGKRQRPHALSLTNQLSDSEVALSLGHFVMAA